MTRIDRLEATIRELTGTVEQLQYRNQQLEQQLRRCRSEPAAPGLQDAARSRRRARPGNIRRRLPHLRRSSPRAAACAVEAEPPPPPPGRSGVAMPSIRRSIRLHPARRARSAPHGRDRTAAAGRRCATRRSAPARRAARSVDVSAPPPPLPPPAAPRRAAPCRRRRRAIRARPAPCRRRCRRARRRRTSTISLTATFCTRTMRSPRTTFATFLRQYPSDRLAPEAQYWLGESHVPAPALSRCRRGLPRTCRPSTTPPRKAPDALLRLGSRSRRSAKRKRPAPRSAKSAQISARLAEREARRRPGTEACPLLTEAVSRRRSERAVSPVSKIRRGLVLAVSGGPDSTALLVLAARWAKAAQARTEAHRRHRRSRPARRKRRARPPRCKRLARRLGVAHRTLRWRGEKPQTGLQEAARHARYRLLARSATRARLCPYRHRAHARRSGRDRAVPPRPRQRADRACRHGARARRCRSGAREIFLVRPLLASSQGAARRDACRPREIAYADDPINRDPRFTRARLRTLMPALAREGLDARGLARLAARLRRAEADHRGRGAGGARGARAGAVAAARTGRLRYRAVRRLPAEVGLRLLGGAIAHTGDEGPVELGKLESAL